VTLDAALAYAANGYPVIPLHRIVEPAPPDVVKAFASGELSKKVACLRARCGCGKLDCQSPGKHPIGPGATAATTSENIIREWWTRWPDANIGVRLPPGVLAVDFDLYAAGVAERLAAFAETNAPTVIQESGAGGEHWLYSFPPDIAPPAWGTSLDGQFGIDLIHHGHRYIVAEPSTHWTGGTYTWRAPPVISTLAPATPELMARCTRGARPIARHSPITPNTSKYAHIQAYRPDRAITPCPEGVSPEDWAILLARKMPPAIEDGQEGGEEHGHVTLARAGARLVAGLCLDPPQAVEILWEHYNPRCVPPWSEDGDGKDNFEDFERIVLNAGRDIPPEERGFLLPPSLKAPTAPEPAADANALRVILGTMGTLVDRASPPTPLQWRVYDVLAPGKVSIIVGSPEAGKGPLALWMSLCVSMGREVFPGKWASEQCTVIYADSETGSLAEERDVRMCNALGIVREQAPVEFLHLDDMFSEEMLGKLDAAARCPGVGMLVVDTYGSTLPGDIEHNDAAFSHWLKQLGKLSRNTGITVLVIMHAKKGGSSNGAELELISGHYSAAGAAQSVIALRTDGDVTEVRCARHPRKKWPPFHFRWVDVAAPGGKYAGVTLDGVPWGLAPEMVSPEDKPEPERRPTAVELGRTEKTERIRIAKEVIMKTFHLREAVMYTAKEVESMGPRNASRDAIAELVLEGQIVGGPGQGYRLPDTAPTPAARFLSRVKK
jgi:hypothetical protein